MTAKCTADIVHELARHYTPFLGDERNKEIAVALADINEEHSADLYALLHDVFIWGYKTGLTDTGEPDDCEMFSVPMSRQDQRLFVAQLLAGIEEGKSHNELVTEASTFLKEAAARHAEGGKRDER